MIACIGLEIRFRLEQDASPMPRVLVSVSIDKISAARVDDCAIYRQVLYVRMCNVEL